MKSKLFNEHNIELFLEAFSMMLLIFIAYLIFLNNPMGLNSFNNGDVHRGFQRGINILHNVNPYLEFNPDQLLNQQKVPAFFPLYFYFMALLARLSDYSFVLFIDNLRLVVFSAYISIGVVIYFLLRKQNKLLAFSSVIFFYFNRWTLSDVLSLKQDAYIILPVLLSFILLNKHKFLAFFLFGLATAVKHLTIFAVPVYFLILVKPIYENLIKKNLIGLKKELKVSFLLILVALAPIIIPSIPFMVDSPKNFFTVMLYPVTRSGQESGDTFNGFDKLLVLYNQDRNHSIFYYMLPRLPMLVAYLTLVGALFLGRLNKWKYTAFAYMIFIGFNAIVFMQYFVWAMAFFPTVMIKESANE